jgi:hypothetical protein
MFCLVAVPLSRSMVRRGDNRHRLVIPDFYKREMRERKDEKWAQ